VQLLFSQVVVAVLLNNTHVRLRSHTNTHACTQELLAHKKAVQRMGKKSKVGLVHLQQWQPVAELFTPHAGLFEDLV
jgi:hypothetical protein